LRRARIKGITFIPMEPWEQRLLGMNEQGKCEERSGPACSLMADGKRRKERDVK
jgi:hypothetical protein